jgi:hypothetical protein
MKYIYVITCGPSFVKVGVAANIAKRIRKLQTGAPLPLKLFDKVRIESDQLAFHYESLAHIKLARFASHGEWFTIAPAEAMAAVTAVIAGPPKDTDTELSIQANREFSRILKCHHCGHRAITHLSIKEICARRFRCTGCGQSIDGRRFFVRRVA